MMLQLATSLRHRLPSAARISKSTRIETLAMLQRHYATGSESSSGSEATAKASPESSGDESSQRRLVPKVRSHHKQFLFAMVFGMATAAYFNA
mmetsp:Transcript_54141/g.86086  ORF Transcript_54141/g.86086 Transcript_54141/m.86086 type:complete len:93 (+) Transcript_54141:63-341(+)